MIIGFSRTIGPVPLNCVLSEDHTSEIEITSNPIETGAEVNDHAYIVPKKITLEFADANAVATWNALVRFQESRVPFVLVTGLAIYRNMMVKSLNAKRDATFARVLSGSAQLQEVIIVDTAYAAAPGGVALPPAGNPGGSGSVLSSRPASSRSIDVGTAIRAAGTVQRGDSPTLPAPLVGNSSAAVLNRAIINGVFG